MPASHAFVHATSAATWLQTTDFNSAENTHLLMIFIGILAVSVAIIALAVLIVAVVVARVVKKVMAITEEVKGKSMPIIASTQGIIGTVQGVITDLKPKIKTVTDDLTPKIKIISDDLQPKIKTISGNVEEMSTVARRNLAKFEDTLSAANDTVKDVNARARAQADKVDGMVSSALSATSNVAQTIHHSIRIPVNQVAGVVSGFKAGLDSLLGSAREVGRGGSFKGAGDSLEARREEEMERIASRYSSPVVTAPVTTGLGEDILPGSSVKEFGGVGTPGGGAASASGSGSMSADVIAGQRRAAEMRSAPDSSDLSEPTKTPVIPVLPKRFQ